MTAPGKTCDRLISYWIRRYRCQQARAPTCVPRVLYPDVCRLTPLVDAVGLIGFRQKRVIGGSNSCDQEERVIGGSNSCEREERVIGGIVSLI